MLTNTVVLTECGIIHVLDATSKSHFLPCKGQSVFRLHAFEQAPADGRNRVDAVAHWYLEHGMGILANVAGQRCQLLTG